MEVERQSCDRISALAQETVEQILSLMPIRDAVRTSILSKRWRHLWTRMPALVLDDEMVDASSDEESRRNKLVNAIFHVLVLHKGPISELCFNITDTEIVKEFDPIILHLSLSKNIKRLTLNVISTSYYKLPSSFFSLQGLNHLELSYCEFEVPLMFNGFPMLKSLIFDVAGVPDNMLRRFLASCPRLEDFTWIYYKPLDILESELVELFKCLPSVQALKISQMYIKDLGAGCMPHKLPISLPHLRILNLRVCFIDLLTVVCVMSSSPNLENIKIKMCYHSSECGERTCTNLRFPKDYTGLNLDRLKKMEIKYFKDCGSWMGFVKYIMAKSPVLKKARIQLHHKASVDEDKLIMLRDLPRASPAAKFIIHQP